MKMGEMDILIIYTLHGQQDSSHNFHYFVLTPASPLHACTHTSLTLTPTHTHTHAHSHSHTHTHTTHTSLTLTPTHTHTHAHSLTSHLPPTLTLAHTHTHTTHTHHRTHDWSWSPLTSTRAPLPHKDQLHNNSRRHCKHRSHL